LIGWIYDLLAERSERQGMAARRQALLADLEGDVIEIGAGTGLNLARYERASRVVAVEPEASMARQLRGRLHEARVPVEVATGRAEALPFPDESFDAAVVTFVLCSVEDPARALAEIWRVLRPGAPLVLLEHVRGGGSLARWQDRLTPLHRKLAGNCHLNRDTRTSLDAAGFDVDAVEPTLLPASHRLVSPGIQGRAIKISS
jgi:ubiquinone/menaquinone biosynthesis C-methylase UbiE